MRRCSALAAKCVRLSNKITGSSKWVTERRLDITSRWERATMTLSQRRWLLLGVAAGASATVAAWLIRKSQAQRLALADHVDEMTRRAFARLGVEAESLFASVNGVRLHTVVAGPKDGSLVVLLHGFPECWFTCSQSAKYRHHIGATGTARHAQAQATGRHRGAVRQSQPGATGRGVIFVSGSRRCSK